jgi:threonine synthase
MKYLSTRGGDKASFSQALIKGLAADGGLFVPESLPDLSSEWRQWKDLSYTQLAHTFLARFLTDIPDEELRLCIDQAYSVFENRDNPAPLIRINENLHVLELFHGPTLAFKDFALQLLGRLYGWHTRNSGLAVNILGATSGDTGSAAIYGMSSIPAAHSFILYPEGRIAELQERQIACTGSPKVHALAIEGSFDEAQGIVKQIFADAEFTAAHSLNAVNSINITRILAQCVYYIHAALQLDANEGNRLEFIVPTGNFGNVLAGMMLAKMGIKGLSFCVATNQNAVVSDFFASGEYRAGQVVPSCAPSMDIQLASNFERWLWWYFDGDSRQVALSMDSLQSKGCFTLNELQITDIRASRCDDQGIRRTIEKLWRSTGYLSDPHTACAFAALRDNQNSVVLATAHPAKFPATITSATGVSPQHPSLEMLKERKITKTLLPAKVDAVKKEIENSLIMNYEL